MGRLSAVVSCEHASNRIPPGIDLGLPRRVLETHVAWDIGSPAVAKRLAMALACPLHLGTVSRLVVDLNRSVRHPRLAARHLDGNEVPGNARLGRAGREERVRAYHVPYRDAVLADLTSAMHDGGTALHLSVHSFTPVFGAVRRMADVGLLYDPSRAPERQLAVRLAAGLAADGLRVRRNYPYRGTSDGFTSWLRKSHGPRRYVGIEIEANQALLAQAGQGRRLADRLAALVKDEVGRRG